MRGFDAFDGSIASMKGKKPLFAVVLHLAHGRIISNMPLDVLIAYADALRGSGRRARGYIHDAIGMAGQDSRRYRQIRRFGRTYPPALGGV